MLLDIFKNDAFSHVSLTEAMMKAPYQPRRLASLFTSRGISTKTAVIEEKDGQLSLIQTSPRGGHTPPSSLGSSKRTARSFLVPHLERDFTIYADEVQDVRPFGSEDGLQAVQQVVDERLAILRQMHEVTHEHMRAGAIQGKVLDADGSTLFDLFAEFGGAGQIEVELDMGVGDDVRKQLIDIKRQAEGALGDDSGDGTYTAFCGDTFFDDLISADQVKESLKYQESIQLRNDPRMGFDFAGVRWENYRGRMAGTALVDPEDEHAGGTTPFFADGEAYLVPNGTSIFRTWFAPADFTDTVNTLGLPIYARQAIDQEFNRWVKLHSQSNPLILCTRPRAVVKLTAGT